MEHQATRTPKSKKRLWMYVLSGVFLGLIIVIILGTLTTKEIEYIETVGQGVSK